jgi:maltose alpha-D-glucosyltransferase / alpha-amylase
VTILADIWYKNAVFYSLDVETFFDGNGDGIGDFEGLSRRLDYLEALGIDVLWLSPFQPSPNRDDGYDVADYYGVDPRYGTLGDFVEFMHQARSRGIRVIIDLVVNHSSDRHPWFREALGDGDSPFHDWYVWSKKRPPDWKSGMVFPGVQEATWTYAREVQKYYFHRFYDFEPDLNMQNAAVRAEIRRIMGFWLELGVAGFRVDAVPFILEKPSTDGGKKPLDFDYLRELREFLQWRVGDAVLLGEANVLPKETQQYFADGDGLHMMFNFWANQHVFYALASGDARPLGKALRETRRLPEAAQWAQFLRNHDELDLGRLSELQRKAVFERFGPEPAMQLYGRGIRRRLASMLGDPRLVRLAYSLMFSLPGSPVLRYGEEIGMGDDLRLAERNSVRTPMQWSAERNAGFSTAEKPVRAAIEKGPYGYETVNVAKQQRDPESLLRWLTRMIRVRTECPEIGWGEWRILPLRTPTVLAMEYRWSGTSVLCVHNFDAQAREIRLALDAPGSERLVSLLEGDDSTAGTDGAHRLALEPFGYGWFRPAGSVAALGRRRQDEARFPQRSKSSRGSR